MELGYTAESRLRVHARGLMRSHMISQKLPGLRKNLPQGNDNDDAADQQEQQFRPAKVIHEVHLLSYLHRDHPVAQNPPAKLKPDTPYPAFSISASNIPRIALVVGNEN